MTTYKDFVSGETYQVCVICGKRCPSDATSEANWKYLGGGIMYLPCTVGRHIECPQCADGMLIALRAHGFSARQHNTAVELLL